MSESVEASLSAPDNARDVAELLPPLNMEDLPDALREACARAGWTELMPVQRHSLPYMLKKQDIMVQSHTGSGKTGAYLLPLLAHLDPAEHTVQALVLTPTRELAVQVEHEARTLFAGTGLDAAAVYGGVGYDRQIAALKQGVALVVGTPGRILDHLLKRTLRLDALRALVFDEADRMLSIGFYPDMKEIQRYLPGHPLHATLFSATYPPHVLRLAGEFLQAPELLSLSGEQVHVPEVAHSFCECSPMDKDRVLLRLIQVENPTAAIVFCNTKANVHYITSVLQNFGVSADELSADLTQNKREAVLNSLRQGTLRILVATDVAARGIDIPALSHVFLYEPPEDREAYIHRAGRTGRAGAAGTVISLVDVMQKLELTRIAQFYHIPLSQLSVPTEADAAEALGHRVQATLEAAYRSLGSLQKERLTQLEPLARQLAANPEQLPLLAMLLDGTYQKCMRPDTAALPAAAGAAANQPGERRARSSRNRRQQRKNPPQSEPQAEAQANASPAVPKEIPAHLAAWIDPDGLDLPEGAEDALFAEKPRKRRRHGRGRRQPSSEN